MILDLVPGGWAERREISMTILRSGATTKYSDNWAAAFGKPKKKKAAEASSKKTKDKKSKSARKKK